MSFRDVGLYIYGLPICQLKMSNVVSMCMYQNIYDITVKRHNLDSMTRIVEHVTSKITYIIFSVL